MVRYFYSWTSAVSVLGAVILLSNVYLALIAVPARVRRIRSVPASAAVLLANPPSQRDT
jgi:hypothetical protein